MRKNAISREKATCREKKPVILTLSAVEGEETPHLPLSLLLLLDAKEDLQISKQAINTIMLQHYSNRRRTSPAVENLTSAVVPAFANSAPVQLPVVPSTEYDLEELPSEPVPA